MGNEFSPDITVALMDECNRHGGYTAELLEGAASEIDLLRDERTADLDLMARLQMAYETKRGEVGKLAAEVADLKQHLEIAHDALAKTEDALAAANEANGRLRESLESRMSLSLWASKFAVNAHGDQLYGDEPYAVHLSAVAGLVDGDETAQVVAYLHDVVEDTPITSANVEAHFGRFIAELVALVTDEPGVNRKERKAATHAKLAQVPPSHYVALKVKAADRVANVEACVQKGNDRLLQMYQREQEAFKAAAYRPGLCDDLWRRISQALKGRDRDGGRLHQQQL